MFVIIVETEDDEESSITIRTKLDSCKGVSIVFSD